MIKREHLDEIQLTRAFAIIAVLFVHSTSSGVTVLEPDSLLYPMYNFLNIAGKLGTPTFIMLSSFVLFYNYYSREVNIELIKRFYLKRLKFILIPYIVFSFIYFSIKADYTSISSAIQSFLELLALGKAHPHLYFVFISVQFYILFPLLLILFKRFAFLRRNAIWIGIALQWLWVILNKNIFLITFKGSIALSYLSFYFLGAYLGIYYNEIKDKLRHRDSRDKIILPLFTGFGIMLVLYTGYMYLTRIGVLEFVSPYIPFVVNRYLSEFTWATYTLMAGLVLFYLAHIANRVWKPRVKMAAMEIGAVSFGIYLIHPLFLAILREVYSSGSPLLYHGWQLLTFLLVSIASWICVRATYYFFPYYWVVFGKMQPIPKKKTDQ